MTTTTAELRTFTPLDAVAFRRRLREIAMFFDKSDRVHQTMERVAARLAEAGIGYAIVGGMAVNAHRYERTTNQAVDELTRQPPSGGA